MDLRPIPAFYCCYLLRSSVRHASLYIGSTPNPKRRLLQHNGVVKGGAFKTSRNTLRPWEMVCIVTGFPSNIAALQFEWTWQNPHLTRRILEEERITLRDTVKKKSKSGKVTKRPARPRMSLKDRLANLHLLLRVPSFARWPLHVRFFSQDVYDTWVKYLNTTDGLLNDNIKVVVDVEPSVGTENPNAPKVNPRVSALEVGYERYKDHLEKSTFLLADGEQVACSVCKDPIVAPGHMALVCSHDGCRSASHVACLSQKFLAEEQSQEMLPSSGTCPDCKTRVQWSDLVTELSLRMRGEKEIAKLMKKRRQRKPKADGSANSQPEPDQEDEDENEDALDAVDDHETICVDDVIDEPLKDQAYDRFVDLDDFEDDGSSVTSAGSQASSPSKPSTNPRPAFKMPPDLTIVIEDSEYDSSEALD